MRTFPEFIATVLRESAAANFAQAVARARAADPLFTRNIRRHLTKLGVEDVDVLAQAEHVREDFCYMRPSARLAVGLYKNASKQGLHEKAQIAWLRLATHPDIEKSVVYVDRRRLSMVRTAGSAIKSFDAYSALENTYFVLKHTDESGGSQDNQFNDVIHTLAAVDDAIVANPLFPLGVKVHAVLDGEYYTRRESARLRVLRERFEARIAEGRFAVYSASDISLEN